MPRMPPPLFIHDARDAVASERVPGERGGSDAGRGEERQARRARGFVIDARGGLIPDDVSEPAEGVKHEREREREFGGVHQHRHGGFVRLDERGEGLGAGGGGEASAESDGAGERAPVTRLMMEESATAGNL